MKRLLFIFYALSLVTNLWANDKMIKMHKTSISEEERHFSAKISASCECSAIYLHSDAPIDYLLVTVKDGTGRVVSSESVSIFPQQPYTFSIGNVEEGIYILELNDGASIYKGYFEIY